MKRIIWLTLAMISMTFYQTNAQSSTPEYLDIGDPVPNVALKDIQYFSKEEASLEEFKGKWLVLDFFTTGCAACFESFPRMNKLTEGLEDQVQLMLVALDDGNVQAAYERYREKLNLDMPITYMERELWDTFGIFGVPHIMVMDEGGMIRAITGKITREDLEEFLSGRDLGLPKKANPVEMETMLNAYDLDKPLLVDGNGGADTAFLFRSVLAAWNGKILGTNQPYVSSKDFGNRVQVIMQSLSSLYYLAYGDTVRLSPIPGKESCYGRFWREPLLEVSDSSEFMDGDHQSVENLYNYSLIVPPDRATSKYLQEVMRRDLKSYFGYKVAVETRMMPYWRLVATKEARTSLKTEGGEWNSGHEMAPRTGMVLINEQVETLVRQLFLMFQTEPPFVDETGIDWNIDLRVEGLTTDFSDFQRGLRENGLDLIKGEKEMKVIVIRDPKPIEVEAN